MCDIIKERIRINKLLAHTIWLRLNDMPVSLDELTELCVMTLQIYYDGACPDECVEAKARHFAAWHLARSGLGGQPARRSAPPQRTADPLFSSMETL